MRLLSLVQRLFVRFRARGCDVTGTTGHLGSAELELLVRAHGCWLAFLAVTLEHEGVIATDDLSRSLLEYAALTSADRPAEGRVLASWAAYLRDASAGIDEPRSHH